MGVVFGRWGLGLIAWAAIGAVRYVRSYSAPMRSWLGRDSHWLLVAGIGLTGLALALRLSAFGQSLFGDELFTRDQVVGRGFGGLVDAIKSSPEMTPPLYVALAWLMTQVSDAFEAIRVPSLLSGVAMVPVALALGRRVFDARAGLLAAGLVALSPFLIFFSTEARPYAFLALASLLSTWLLLVAIEQRRLVWWIAFTIAIAAVVYTHYAGIFVVVAQTAWALVVYRRRALPVLGSAAVAALLYLPWVGQVSGKGNLFIYGPVRLGELPSTFLQVIPGHPFVSASGTVGVIAVVALLGAVVAGAVVGWIRRGSSQVKPPGGRGSADVWLLVVVALATPVGLVVYSVLAQNNLLLPRNFSASVPVAFVLAAGALTRPRGALAVVLPVVALAAMTVGTVQALSDDAQRPPVADVARYLDRNLRAGTILINAQSEPSFGPPGQVLRLYQHDAGRQFPLSQSQAAWTEAARLHLPVAYVWVPPASLKDRFAQLARPPAQFASGYRIAAEKRWPGFYRVYYRLWNPR